jgi:integrase
MSDGGSLFLWVTPAGGKLWRWAYTHEGKEKLMTFGKYPDVPLALARERQAEARKLLAIGLDPMAQRKAAKTAEKAAAENSFRTIAGLWLEHWRAEKSAQHVDATWRRMDANILPLLGARPITEIEAPELVTIVKTIEGRGAADLAKRAMQNVGQIFRYAIAHGYAKRNPASEIRPADILRPTHKTNLARIDAKELPALLRSIEVYQGTHVTRLAMKLMALTFVRTSELIGAKWAEFNIEAARWDIPAARMKMRDPHIVPLASQAIEVLEMLRTLSYYRQWICSAYPQHLL